MIAEEKRDFSDILMNYLTACPSRENKGNKKICKFCVPHEERAYCYVDRMQKTELSACPLSGKKKRSPKKLFIEGSFFSAS